MLRPSRLLAPVLALVVASACAPAVGDLKNALAPGDKGAVWFRVPPKLVMSGVLDFPRREGRVPAIVLMHGCSGLPSRVVTGWEPVLHEWGYATFVVESFGPRGHREVCTNGAISSVARVADAYGALAILRTHPRIDPDRIVLMGFSHGGLTAVIAATDWAVRHAHAPDHRFRASLAFYPSCIRRVEQPVRVVVPLRIHIGERDDWTPAPPCVERVAEYRALGSDVDIVVYPDAPHAFDAVGGTIAYLPNVLNSSACRLVLARIDSAPAAGSLDCVRRGATSGYHAPATEQARTNVKAQLTELLR